MANGLKGLKGAISEKELEIAKRLAPKGGARNGRLKKLLGMTKRPTVAGQERFGDVDVSGRDLKGALSLKGAISEKELEIAKRAAGY
jgi:hypothetical protein